MRFALEYIRNTTTLTDDEKFYYKAKKSSNLTVDSDLSTVANEVRVRVDAMLRSGETTFDEV